MLQRRNKLKDFLMSALFVFGATHAFAQETTEFQVNHGPYLQEVTARCEYGFPQRQGRGTEAGSGV